MSLGEKVKEVRKSLGLTQKELSAKLGITRGYLSDIERGRIKGTVSLLNKLSDVSGKPLTYFAASDDDIKIKQYEILDNTIDMLMSAGEITKGEISSFAKDMLLKVLEKEIEVKFERNNSEV